MSTQKVSWDEYNDAVRLANKLVDTLFKAGMKEASRSVSASLWVVLTEMQERLGE